MKKTILFLAAVLMLFSCQKEIDSTSDEMVEIKLSSGMNASATTRAAITTDYFPTGNGVYAVTAYKGDAEPTSFSGSYFENAFVNSTATDATNENNHNAFATAKYYPMDGGKLYFYAYAPVVASDGTVGHGYTAGSGETTPNVTWTIDGQQDIMSAKNIQGISKTTAKDTVGLIFHHQLQLLKFKFKAAEGFDASGVKVTSIKISGMKTNPTLDLKAGTLNWAATTGDFTISPNADINDKEITETILTEPVDALPLTVVAGGITYSLPDFTLQKEVAAGNSHLITLTFTPTGIIPTATIVNWKDAGESTGVLK